METVGAIFSLLSAEAFREFMSGADRYTYSDAATGFTVSISLDWKFGYSWILMVVAGICQLIMVLLTIYLYWEKIKVQDELDQQLFV
jgi:hypothetical protein